MLPITSSFKMAASPWTVQSSAQTSSMGRVESRRSSSATKSANTGSQTSNRIDPPGRQVSQSGQVQAESTKLWRDSPL